MQVISLGNDIVDLADPDTVDLSQNSKFLKRVYADSELDAAQALAETDRSRLLWKLWAAKEAAYKAVKRMRPDVFFSPRSFCYSPNPDKIIFQDICCMLEFVETGDYLHASALVYDAEKDVLLSGSGSVSGFVGHPGIQLDIGSFDEIRKAVSEHHITPAESYSAESALCRTFAAMQIARRWNTPGVRLVKVPDTRSGIPQIYLDDRPTSHLVSTSHHGRFCSVLFYPHTLPGASL